MFEYNYEYDQYSRFFRFYFQVLLLDRARVGRVVHHERILRSTHDGNGTGNRTGNRTRNGTVDSEDVLAGNTTGESFFFCVFVFLCFCFCVFVFLFLCFCVFVFLCFCVFFCFFGPIYRPSD